MENNLTHKTQRRRLPALFVLLALLLLIQTAGAQTKTVTVDFRNIPMSEAINRLETISGYDFLYNNALIDATAPVTISKSDRPISEVLDEMFRSTDIKYKIIDSQVLLSNTEAALNEAAAAARANRQQAQAQGTHAISGRITSAQDGSPLDFITVTEKGTSRFVYSDVNGNYRITVGKPDGELVFSHMNYETRTVRMQNRNVIDVALQPRYNLLDDVVVTGYQTISKERTTGSFGTLNKDLISKQISANLLDALEGKVAGVVKTGTDLLIRGVGSLRVTNNPLYVIDGFPVEGETASQESFTDITSFPPNINPEEIENITILKDAAAASIYGARAANGVVVITTKKARKGTPQVNFSAKYTVTPKASYDYLNYISANTYIDLQQEFVDGYTNLHNASTRPSALSSIRNNWIVGGMISPTLDLMLRQVEGTLTAEEARRQIDAYRSAGNPLTDDIEKYALRAKSTQRYYLSVGKATDGANTFASVSYTDDKSEAKNNRRYNFDVNLRNTTDLYKWLSADFNVNINYGKADLPDYTPGRIVANYETQPYTRLVDEQGNFIPLPWGAPTGASGYYAPYYKNYLDNLSALKSMDLYPIEEMGYNIAKTRNFRTRASVNLNFKIVSWLGFTSGFSFERGQQSTGKLWNKESAQMREIYNLMTTKSGSTYTYRLPYADHHSQTEGYTENYTWRNQLNFNWNCGDQHAVTAIAGTEVRQISGGEQMNRIFGYDAELLTYVVQNNADLTKSATSVIGMPYFITRDQMHTEYESLNRYVSTYANASYSFKNRYDLTGSIRWDLTNFFGTNPKDQYKPMWSVGAGWNVTSEEFMPQTDWLNRLRLRATYGVNGNAPRGSSPYLIADFSSTVNSITNNPYASVSSAPNSRLRWEKVKVFNTGIDLSLLNNRINTTVEYYVRRSEDLLASYSLDPAYGFSSSVTNVGQMKNNGVEVTLNAVALDHKDWRWTVGATFAYNDNKVTKLYVKATSVTDFITGGALAEGRPYSSLYGYRFSRIDETGAPVIFDEKGEETTGWVNNLGGEVYGGTVIPPYSGGLWTSVSWKGLELSVNFVYNAGHKMRKPSTTLQFGAIGPQSFLYDGYANRWRQPGDEKKPGVTPRISFTGSDYVSYDADPNWNSADVNIISASYIKLRSVSLSYRLPARLLKKTGFIREVSFMAQANDLFYLADNNEGIDPEHYLLDIGKLMRKPSGPGASFSVNLAF